MLILSPSRTVWDESSVAGGNLSLSDRNLTATWDQPPYASAYPSVRSTTSKRFPDATGKWLCQFILGNSPVPSNTTTIGFTQLGYPPNTLLGQQTGSVALAPESANPNSCRIWIGGGNLPRPLPWAVGDVFQLALDLTTNTLVFWFRNATQGSGWTATLTNNALDGTPDVYASGWHMLTAFTLDSPIFIASGSLAAATPASPIITIRSTGGAKPPGATTFRWWD